MAVSLNHAVCFKKHAFFLKKTMFRPSDPDSPSFFLDWRSSQRSSVVRHRVQFQRLVIPGPFQIVLLLLLLLLMLVVLLLVTHLFGSGLLSRVLIVVTFAVLIFANVTVVVVSDSAVVMITLYVRVASGGSVARITRIGGVVRFQNRNHVVPEALVVLVHVVVMACCSTVSFGLKG